MKKSSNCMLSKFRKKKRKWHYMLRYWMNHVRSTFLWKHYSVISCDYSMTNRSITLYLTMFLLYRDFNEYKIIWYSFGIMVFIHKDITQQDVFSIAPYTCIFLITKRTIANIKQATIKYMTRQVFKFLLWPQWLWKLNQLILKYLSLLD